MNPGLEKWLDLNESPILHSSSTCHSRPGFQVKTPEGAQKLWSHAAWSQSHFLPLSFLALAKPCLMSQTPSMNGLPRRTRPLKRRRQRYTEVHESSDHFFWAKRVQEFFLRGERDLLDLTTSRSGVQRSLSRSGVQRFPHESAASTYRLETCKYM